MPPVPFHSESRQQLGNGRPTWLGHPFHALPGLYIEPEAQGPGWQAMVMVEASWRYREGLAMYELVDLLRDWAAGPEEALLAWFGCQAPVHRGKGKSARPVDHTEASVEDLGL